MATIFTIASLALIGLPMLNGFVGEFLVLSSTFAGASRTLAVIATAGVILSAAYMLWLIQRIFLGPISDIASNLEDRDRDFDLDFRERLVLWPLAVLMLVMGLAPALWLRAIEPAIQPATLPAQVHTAAPTPPVSAQLVVSGGQQ